MGYPYREPGGEPAGGEPAGNGVRPVPPLRAAHAVPHRHTADGHGADDPHGDPVGECLPRAGAREAGTAPAGRGTGVAGGADAAAAFAFMSNRK